MREVFRSRGMQLLRTRSALLAFAIVSGLSVTSSAIGFVFQVILAARFGAGKVIDSYLFAISAPTFLAGLGAAALSYTLVPALVRVEEEPAARVRLLRRLRRQIGSVAIGFALIGLPATRLQGLFLPSAADLHDVSVLPIMIGIGWAIGGTQLFAALFVIELNASRRPIKAALLSLPPNIGAILVVLLGPRSILAAPTGVLIGSLATAGLGLTLTVRAFDASEGARSLQAPLNPVRFDRLGWSLLAMSCFSAYAIIDAFWAPRAGSGMLATLGYAQRLIIGIGALIIAGPSAILTPRFAARLRDHGLSAFKREVMRTLLVIGLIAGVTAAVLGLFADLLIRVAFSRGAFNAADVTRVASVLRVMLPGFCAMLVSVAITRAIYCLEGMERPMAMVGLGWSSIYFLACGALIGMGGIGFGISYSIAWLSYTVIAIVILHRYARSPIGTGSAR